MDLLGNLVDALRDAGLQANPGRRRRYQQALRRRAHGGVMPDPDLDPDSDDDDNTPRVKIPPPIFKGLPGERPDAHIYAAEDWMEAMHFREDQYIDKFKHTLNHLAQEWYHSLEILSMVIGKSLPNILAGISLPKVKISSICMKDGEPFLLTQPMMT